MTRRAAPVLICLGIAGTGLAAPALADRPKISPFIDIEQFAEQQLKGTGDSVTYTEFSAGLDAEFKTRRITATVGYRYSQRVPESGNTQTNRSHDGVARISVDVVRDLLSLDAGAIATHARQDASGAAPQTNTGAAANLTQVFSYYVSPSISHTVGEVDVGASYRFGYAVSQGTASTLAANVPANDHFESSMNQLADVSIGMKRSSLPFDWTLKGEYELEHTTQLAQHYRSGNVTFEAVVPLTRTIAAVASGGYQATKTSQKASLLDANGAPVTDSKGRFLTNPAAPRTLTYDVAGLVADGGLIWRPSHRTRLELRAGYRYNGLTLSGSFEYQPGTRSGMSLTIFDRIDSFGRGITNGLAQTPASFDPSQTDDSSNPYQNCLFGKKKGTGSCLASTLSTATASPYRSRGGNFLYTYRMRRTQLNFAIGYERRDYIDLPGAPGSLAGVVDQSIFFQGGLSEELTRTSGISFAISGNLFKNGQPGAVDVKSVALNGAYFQTFGRGLRAQASIGVEASKQDGSTADISGRAQLGVRYQF